MANDGHVDSVIEGKVEHEAGWRKGAKASHNPVHENQYRTAIAVAGSTEDGYALRLELCDHGARAFPGVIACVFREPASKIEGTSLHLVPRQSRCAGCA